MTGPRMTRHSQSDARKASAAFPRAGAPRPVFNPRSPADYGTDKAVLQALYEDIGGPKRAAVVLGYGATKTYDLANPDHPEALVEYRQVRQLTVAGGRAAAEDLALLAGGAFLPLPEAQGALLGLTADMLRQHGEAVAQLMPALADGRVDRAEALQNLPNIHALMADVAAVYAVLLARAGLSAGGEG